MTEPQRGGIGSLIPDWLKQVPSRVLHQLVDELKGSSPFESGMPPRPMPTSPMPDLGTPEPPTQAPLAPPPQPTVPPPPGGPPAAEMAGAVPEPPPPDLPFAPPQQVEGPPPVPSSFVGPTAPNPAGGQTSVLGELAKGIAKQSIYDPERAKGPEDIDLDIPPGLARSFWSSINEVPEWAGGSLQPEELVKPSEMEHLRQPMGPPKPKPPQGGPSMSLQPPEQLFPEQVEPPTATQEIEGPPGWMGGKADRNTGTTPTMTDEDQMVEFLKNQGATLNDPGYSEMPPDQARDLKQGAVLEQAFGSPGRESLSPSRNPMARKSPFDASRDEEPYMSAEALAKRLKDERGFSVNDQFLAAAAGMLSGEDLSSGMSAMFDAIRGPRERYQKLEQELPGQYSETRVRRERDRLEDERLGRQVDVVENQDRRAQEVHEDEDVTREAAKRRDAAGAINDALLEADRLYKNGQTAEAEQRIKESIAQVQTLAQMTRSNINVNEAQIKDLEARAAGTGGYSGRYGVDEVTPSSVLTFQNQIAQDIENAEFPSAANATGMKLWYAADRIGGFSEDEADRMQPYSFDAAMIKQLLLDKVPPEQIMKDYPDIEGSPLESLLRYYQEMTAAALQGQ